MFKNTPHIKIENEIGFGNTVLMPGDPLRSKFIAENFLDDAVLVNNVRGVQGYTGYYKGIKVSVMASGMGIPAIGIYSYELFNFFDVQNIVRIGSAGALSREVGLRDIVAAMGACTNSNFASQYELNGNIAPICDYDLLRITKDTADELGYTMKIGNLYSSDTFYDDMTPARAWQKMGCLAVEMESSGLYLNALRCQKRALAICTISDLAYEPFEGLSSEERQCSFTQMMTLALESAVKFENLPKREARNDEV